MLHFAKHYLESHHPSTSILDRLGHYSLSLYSGYICRPMLIDLVTVAKCSSLGVQDVLERSIARQRSHVDLEVESDVLAAVVKRLDRPADLVETSLQVLLLPLPEDTIDVAVVKVEEGV